MADRVAAAGASPARRFCLVWLSMVAGLLLATGVVNAVIDPYLVVGAPRIAGLNAIKPETETHTELAKDYLIVRTHPSGLMLGDSKVDIGLDPLSPAWPADARPVFNDGVPGIRLENVAFRLRSALAVGQVRRVLLLVNPQEVMAPAPPEIAPPPASRGWALFSQTAHDVMLATLSLDALRASFATIAAQVRADVVDMSPLGATGEGGFRADIAGVGYDAVFVQKDADLIARFARLAARLRGLSPEESENLAPVAALIALCRQNGIELDIVIPPVHADYLEALADAGLWPRYEHVKSSLTALIAQDGGAGTRLWDFGGYDAVATEPVPAPRMHGAGTEWFWEPSHFKKVLGEKLLSAVYQAAAYGVRLTPDMLAAHLAADEEAKRHYEAEDAGSRSRLQRAAHGG